MTFRNRFLRISSTFGHEMRTKALVYARHVKDTHSVTQTIVGEQSWKLHPIRINCCSLLLCLFDDCLDVAFVRAN